MHICDRCQITSGSDDDPTWHKANFYVGLPSDAAEIDLCISRTVISQQLSIDDPEEIIQKLTTLGLVEYENIPILIPEDDIREDEQKFDDYYFHSKIGKIAVSRLGCRLFEATKDVDAPVATDRRRSRTQAGKRKSSKTRKKAPKS
jgi:hypothetical protein